MRALARNEQDLMVWDGVLIVVGFCSLDINYSYIVYIIVLYKHDLNYASITVFGNPDLKVLCVGFTAKNHQIKEFSASTSNKALRLG